MTDKGNGKRPAMVMFGEIDDEFSQNIEEIYRAIYPGVEPVAGNLTPTLMTGVGGTSSTLVQLVNSVPGRQDRFFMVKCYGDTPRTYKGKVEPCKRGALTLGFLQRAGIANSLRYFWPKGKKVIFLELVSNGMPLKQAIKNYNNSPRSQEDLLIDVTGPLAEFQYKATAASVSLSSNESEAIFSGRKMEEKAREYGEALFGGEGDIEDYILAYRLIGRAHEGACVIDGDPSGSNILVLPDGRGHVFLDTELEKADGLDDIGSLLGYSSVDMPIDGGVKERIGLLFKKARLETAVRLGGGQLEGGIDVTNEAVRREVLFKTYASMIHKCTKILAKNTRTGIYTVDEEEILMEQNGANLREFISNPEKFGLTEDDVNAARVLWNFYQRPRVKSSYRGPKVTTDSHAGTC